MSMLLDGKKSSLVTFLLHAANAWASVYGNVYEWGRYKCLRAWVTPRSLAPRHRCGGARKVGHRMQTPIRELSGPVLAGGVTVLLGSALWRLGLEYERAWLRADGGPLMGETADGRPADAGPRTETKTAITDSGMHRRLHRAEPGRTLAASGH